MIVIMLLKTYLKRKLLSFSFIKYVQDNRKSRLIVVNVLNCAVKRRHFLDVGRQG